MDYKGTQGTLEVMDILTILIVMIFTVPKTCQNFVTLYLNKGILKMNKLNWCIYTTEIYAAVLKNKVELIFMKDFQDIK